MRDLIRKGRLEEAIAVALEITKDSELYDGVLSISASYRNFKRKLIMGVLNTEQENLQHAQLVNRLLDLMNEYEILQIKSMQEDIRSLIDVLNKEPDPSAKQIAQKLQDIQYKSIDDTDKAMLVKSNDFLSKVKGFFIGLSDSNSSENSIIKGLGRGVEIVKIIAKKYNHIAEWSGLTQVPGEILKL